MGRLSQSLLDRLGDLLPQFRLLLCVFHRKVEDGCAFRCQAAPHAPGDHLKDQSVMPMSRNLRILPAQSSVIAFYSNSLSLKGVQLPWPLMGGRIALHILAEERGIRYIKKEI
jgi:hypothetical protein